MTMYIVSLGSELVIGNRPIVLRYDGSWFFPAFNHRYYSAKLFGSKIDLETDFRELRDKPAFKEKGGFMIMPLHPYSPIENITVPGDPPPSHPNREHPLGTD